MDEDDLEIEIDVEEIRAPPAAAQAATFAPQAAAVEPQVLTVEPPVAAVAGQAAAGTAASALPPQFARVTEGIANARLRNLVTNIYVRQLKALNTLAHVERVLNQKVASDAARLFAVVRRQCLDLLSYLGNAFESADFLDDEVRDALDGMRFVLSHETAKVFRTNFNAPQSRAELTRAWGLMNNCFQQTAITLAQAFDPAACGEQLFADYRSKVENSLTLYRELNDLLDKVERARVSSGILLKHSLIRHVELFRDETMHFLMYRDWAEFLGFVEKLKRAYEEVEAFDEALHEFALYLDTLIHHVSMREVLRRGNSHAAQDDSATPLRAVVPRVGQTVG
jgi:hypothetical protein